MCVCACVRVRACLCVRVFTLTGLLAAPPSIVVKCGGAVLRVVVDGVVIVVSCVVLFVLCVCVCDLFLF